MECPPEQDRSPVKVALGLFLTTGIVVSFLPQHIKMIRLRSSEGLSALFVLFAGIAGTSTLLNVWILQNDTMRCCHTWSPAYCFENILGVIQVTVQWITLHLVIFLFIACFPDTKKWTPLSGSSTGGKAARSSPLLDEDGDYDQVIPVEDDLEEAGTPPLAIPAHGLVGTAPPLSATPAGSYAQDQLVSRPGPSYVPPSPGGSRPSEEDEDGEEDEQDDERTGLLGKGSRRRSSRRGKDGGYPPSTPPRSSSFSVPFLEPPIGTTPSRTFLRAISVITILLIYFVLSLFFALLIMGLDKNAAIVYAGILGLVSTVFSAVQFLPQIVHTWQEGRVGSLSVAMLAMQAPGSFLFVYSLMLQPGTNISTWFPYLLSGLAQCLLLFLALWYTYGPPRWDQEKRDKLAKMYEEAEEDAAAVVEEDVL